MKKFTIIQVEKDSIAEELGIAPGDSLLSINGEKIQDIFDYRYAINDEYIEVAIEKPNGEQWILEIDKEETEDLGLVFTSGLMDNAKSCRNKCLFCFIDQLPKGMRESLYFKDDDSRLSFLQGNYVTLTNMSQTDIERIVYYHLSPINISVHTTNPSLRTSMLQNPNAGDLTAIIEKFCAAGITMNFQIVLCKGINDKQHLDQSIQALSRYIPYAKSLSVVPVGITKYRDCNCLHPLEPFNKQDAQEVLRQVEAYQQLFLSQYSTRFVYCADEFYLKAEESLPKYEAYEDFPQIENGIGMISSMQYEFDEALGKLELEQHEVNKTISIATGEASYNLIQQLSKRIEERVNTVEKNGLVIRVFAIKNHFFGEHITVSGLLTGQDIIAQLKDQPLGDMLFVPSNALRHGEPIFLDDTTIEDIEKALNLPVSTAGCSGAEFIQSLLWNGNKK